MPGFKPAAVSPVAGRPIKLVHVLVALATTAPLAGAAHYDWCTPSTSSPEIDVLTPLGRWYVDNDAGSDFISIWVYEESNGQSGLQRQDEVVDNTCGHGGGDTIIF